MSIAQGTTVLEKIRQRGYWFVAIRPAMSQESRVRSQDLFAIIDRNSVGFRGWSYPQVDHQNLPRPGRDWIEQDYDRGGSIEFWRFHTNGLFAHYFAMAIDWRDESRFWPDIPVWQPNKFTNYLDAIYNFVEIFEFAARLAQSPAGGLHMRVDITLKNIPGRQIVGPRTIFRPVDHFVSPKPEWTDGWHGPQTELIARPRELAAQFAQNFFFGYGLDVSLNVLGQLQEGIGRRQVDFDGGSARHDLKLTSSFIAAPCRSWGWRRRGWRARRTP